MADALLKPPALGKSKSTVGAIDAIFAGAEKVACKKEDLVRHAPGHFSQFIICRQQAFFLLQNFWTGASFPSSH